VSGKGVRYGIVESPFDKELRVIGGVAFCAYTVFVGVKKLQHPTLNGKRPIVSLPTLNAELLTS